jgi:hypothetical protein
MRNLALFTIALMSIGCGGGQAASDDTAGLDDTEAVGEEPLADETSGDEEAEPPATGPGQLRVVNRVGGEDSTGTVRVLSASGEVVAEGASGDTFNVEAGSYRLVGEITDADVLVDTPTHESDGMITVLAGQEQTATIDHPRARVRIRVTRRGRAVARWRMEIRRQGEEGAEPLELRNSEQHTPITPGRYDATLHFGTNQIEVTGIIFQGGATMDVPVNVD